MTKLFVDTCVWLDLAKDPNQQALLPVIDELIELGALEVIVPRIVYDEFHRNKARITEENRRSLTGTIKRIKDVISKFGDDEEKENTLSYLSDIGHKVPLMEEWSAQGSVNWITLLLDSSTIIETSQTAIITAAKRALEKRAPFHRNKNSIADAIIIETYIHASSNKKAKGTNFIFVTSNYTDFSDPAGNHKHPHPDFAKFFSKRKSRYYITLAEALQSIKPKLVPEMLLYHKEILGEPRTLSELLTTEKELVDKIWYNRHQVSREKIEEGRIKIVERSQEPYNGQTMYYKDIWDGAMESAKRVAENYGIENVGPWTDFEWGMLNGKLSAIRWFLGEEWDSLYT